MRPTVVLLACAASLTLSAAVHAQQLDNPRTDYTAYTRPTGVIALGPLKIEHGIIDEIMVGTYVPPWFAFPWLNASVPSLYAKFRSSWWDPVTLSLRGSIAYLDKNAVIELSDSDTSTSAVSTTGELASSWLISEHFTTTLAVDYARLRAVGEADGDATSVEGASSAHSYSIHGFGEWRPTRVFAVTLLLRYLVYQSPVSADATADSDPVSVEGDLSGEPASQARFSIVPGASFVFKHWEISAGAGYGAFYLPVLGLTRVEAGPIVDFGFAWRFDLYD